MNIKTYQNRQKVFPSIGKWIRIQFLHQKNEKLKILEAHGNYQQDVWFYRWFYKRDGNYQIELLILPIDYVFSNCVVSSSVIIGSIFFSCQHLLFRKTQNIQACYTWTKRTKASNMERFHSDSNLGEKDFCTIQFLFDQQQFLPNQQKLLLELVFLAQFPKRM